MQLHNHQMYFQSVSPHLRSSADAVKVAKVIYQTPDAHIFHCTASCPLCFWSHLSVISLSLSAVRGFGAATTRFLSLLIDVVRQLPSITARVSGCLPALLSQVAVASDTRCFYLGGASIDFSGRHAEPAGLI